MKINKKICCGCPAYTEKEFWSEGHTLPVDIEKTCVIHTYRNGEGSVISYPLWDEYDVPENCLRKLEHLVINEIK